MNIKEFYGSIDLIPEVKKKIVEHIRDLIPQLVRDGYQLHPYGVDCGWLWDKENGMEDLPNEDGIFLRSIDGSNISLHCVKDRDYCGPWIEWDREGHQTHHDILYDDRDGLDIANLRISLWESLPEMGKPNISLAKAYPIWKAFEESKRLDKQVEDGLKKESWREGTERTGTEERGDINGEYFQIRLKKSKEVIYSQLRSPMGVLKYCNDNLIKLHPNPPKGRQIVGWFGAENSFDLRFHTQEQGAGLQSFVKGLLPQATHGVSMEFFPCGDPKSETYYRKGEVRLKGTWSGPGAMPQIVDYRDNNRVRQVIQKKDPNKSPKLG